MVSSRYDQLVPAAVKVGTAVAASWAPAGGATSKRTVVSSPALASLTGRVAGEAAKPAGSLTETDPSTPSRLARTRRYSGAGRPLGARTASRVGVTVAGGRTRSSRVRSPWTLSVQA